MTDVSSRGISREHVKHICTTTINELIDAGAFSSEALRRVGGDWHDPLYNTVDGFPEYIPGAGGTTSVGDYMLIEKVLTGDKYVAALTTLPLTNAATSTFATLGHEHFSAPEKLGSNEAIGRVLVTQDDGFGQPESIWVDTGK